MQSPYLALREEEEPSSESLVELGRDWLFLSFQLPMLLRRRGWLLRGFSLSLSRDRWTLCVRLHCEGVAQVVFVSKPTTTDCVSTFRRKWNAGTLSFFPDKYA